jgi:predicted nucleic acid-binding Zn ribbon protein
MRQIGTAMPGAIAELLRGAPLSPGKVDLAWKVAVGSAFDKVTSVHLEGTILLVDADTTQWAREVGRSSPIILRRLQMLLGDNIVASISVRSRQPDKTREPRTTLRKRRTGSRES